MRQMPFEWRETGEVEALDAVGLEPQTMETVIAVMANALIAVVRGAEPTTETADER